MGASDSQNIIEPILQTVAERKTWLTPDATTISFTGKELIDEQGIAIASELRMNTTLQTLSLHVNYLGDRTALALANALLHNKTLTELNLRENRITARGARALAEVLHRDNKTIMQLYLNHNWFGKTPHERNIFWLVPGRVQWRPFKLSHSDEQLKKDKLWWKEEGRMVYFETFLRHSDSMYNDIVSIIVDYIVE